MPFFIIESYEGDRLTTRLSNGILTGRGIISLMGGLVLYCEDNSELGERENSFFQSLAEKWNSDICAELCDLYYNHAYYNGKGLSTQSEKSVYTVIDNCIVQLEKLFQILQEAGYQSNVWYEAHETDQEIEAFLSALKTLKDHGAQAVKFVVPM